MKNKRWIGFVALRYVSLGRKASPSTRFSVLGIAAGVMVLIVILAVMNGFQLGFIESILEISSGHLRLEGIAADETAELANRIRQLPEVVSVLPFREYNVLLRGRQPNPRGALVRAVPVNAFELDPGLESRLEIVSGSFDLSSPGNIVLGVALARHLSVRVGDFVNLLTISAGFGLGDDDDESQDGSRIFSVTGMFNSGFHDYDLGWAFINIETALDASTPEVLGIKLANRWHDQRAMAVIGNILPAGASLRSWRDYNRAFFSALRTEKLMMFILLALIFIVVGLNIFQAQRRVVFERREEIGLLRALGASDWAVRFVFVLDGIIIGLAGAGLGLGIGLLLAFNVQAFFSILEWIVNLVLNFLNIILGFFGHYMGTGEFFIFSPHVFYIGDIPSRVIPFEVFLIVMFGFLSSLLATWFASAKVSGTRPAEVLRYE